MNDFVSPSIIKMINYFCQSCRFNFSNLMCNYKTIEKMRDSIVRSRIDLVSFNLEQYGGKIERKFYLTNDQ